MSSYVVEIQFPDEAYRRVYPAVEAISRNAALTIVESKLTDSERTRKRWALTRPGV